VLAPRPTEGARPAFVAWGAGDRDRGVRVARLPAAALRRALWERRSAWDVLHLHGSSPPHWRWAALCARVARRPLVLSPHLDGTPAPALLRLLRRAAKVLADDGAEAVALREAGVPSRRLVEVGSPLPETGPGGGEAALADRSAGEELVVFAGRVGWESGVLTFIDAVRLLRLGGRPVVGVLMGEYAAVDDYLRRLWLTAAVPLVEVPLADAATRLGVLARARAVVLPGDAHAADALEAWAAGRPILAPFGAAPALGDDALVRFPAGEPMRLASALGGLLADPAPGAALVDRCRAYLAAAPTWAEVGARVEGGYRAVTSARR
jgi:glycosyltransferase involved in cell wall biosynthesis